jgi:hypothetical protein
MARKNQQVTVAGGFQMYSERPKRAKTCCPRVDAKRKADRCTGHIRSIPGKGLNWECDTCDWNSLPSDRPHKKRVYSTNLFPDPARVDAAHEPVVKASTARAFREELHRLYAEQDAERRSILKQLGVKGKPATLGQVPVKFRKQVAERMHKFSVTQEQVVASVKAR